LKNSFSYRSIFTSLRPQKVVTLIDINDEDWIDSSMRVIEYYSQLWGGNYNLIVPTDGKEIDDMFMRILREYDPDYIYKYSKSLLDLKYINNKKYREKINIDIKKAKKAYKGINEFRLAEWVEEQAGISEYEELDISEEMKQKLVGKLNPFYERDNFISSHSIHSEQRPDYPLTNITGIIKSVGLEKITNLVVENCKIMQLISHSIIGSANYIKLLNKNTTNNFSLEEKIYVKENIESLLNLIYPNKYSSNFEEVENLLQYTPFELTMKNLEYLHLRDKKEPEVNDTVVVIVGDSFKDFCLYYNLLKLKKDAIWLPYNLIKKENILENYLIKIYSAISEKSKKRIETKETIFTTMSLDEKEMNNIIKKCQEYDIGINDDKISVSKDLKKLMPFINYIYEKDNYTNTNVGQFLEGKSIELINLPFPRSSNFNLKNIDPLEFRWVNDIQIGSYVSGNLDRGYILPTKKVFSEYLFERGVYNSFTRVSERGISICGPYFTPFAMGDSLVNVVNRNRPRLNILDDYDVIRIMLEDIGYAINLSDKGKYLLESLKKVGSLEKLANIFLDNNKFNLLKEFIKDNNKDIGENNYIIDGRIYIDYDTIESFLKDDTEIVLDDFIISNIFHRGFIFKCNKCGNTDWYQVSEINNNFKCKRCSNVQLYLKDNWKLKKSPKEPKWYYKLDEIFYQGLDNDMYVSVLTLNKLQKSCKKSFIYLPEIDLFYSENGHKKKKEIDICCVCDGKIILGECKKSNRLEKTEKKEIGILKIFADIFLKLNADKCLFSTYSSNWRDKTSKMINNFFPESKIIYNHDDLQSN